MKWLNKEKYKNQCEKWGPSREETKLKLVMEDHEMQRKLESEQQERQW